MLCADGETPATNNGATLNLVDSGLWSSPGDIMKLQWTFPFQPENRSGPCYCLEVKYGYAVLQQTDSSKVSYQLEQPYVSTLQMQSSCPQILYTIEQL